MSSSRILHLSPCSHGLSVVRRRDGRGSGQVSLPHTMPLTLTWGGGGGELAASVAGAGVGLVALQHILRIRGRGGEVLEKNIVLGPRFKAPTKSGLQTM